MKNVVELRRDLHKIPEIAFHEDKTKTYIKNFIAESAKSFQLVDESIGGLIYYKPGDGGSVLWRSEMDGLPLNDERHTDYASKLSGMCHSCGHDAHMAILLTAMREVSEKETPNIYCIFQSAEEAFAGAKKLVGRIDQLNIKVDAAFSIHVDPSQSAGTVSTKSGLLLSQNDTYVFNIDFGRSHLANGNTQIRTLNSVINFVRVHQSSRMRIGISSLKDDGYLNIAPSKLGFTITFRNLGSKNSSIINDFVDTLKEESDGTRIVYKQLPHYPAFGTTATS